MAYKRKLRQGTMIMSLSELDIWTSSPTNWVFWHHKPLHPYWIRNMNFGMLARAVEYGELHRAVRIEQENNKCSPTNAAMNSRKHNSLEQTMNGLAD